MSKVVIIPSDEFKRQAKRLAKKYKSFVSDLIEFQRLIMENPSLGVDLGGGKHKVRLGIRSKGKGKRGGCRVITYMVDCTENDIKVYLVTIYDKSEFENVSDVYVNQIIRGLE